MREPASDGEHHQADIGPKQRAREFGSRDNLRVRNTRVQGRRGTRSQFKSAVSVAVEVEEQVARQRMPEGHTPEHHEDDRDDDEDVEEEV